MYNKIFYFNFFYLKYIYQFKTKLNLPKAATQPSKPSFSSPGWRDVTWTKGLVPDIIVQAGNKPLKL